MFPDPIVLFGIPIHMFGVFVALGIFLGYKVAFKEASKLGVSEDFFVNLALVTIISGLIGARVVFILSNLHFYQGSFLKIFASWQGGLVSYGGLLGGIVGSVFFCKRMNFSFWKIADPVILGLVLGLSIGRLGCLAAGCCYGKPTSLPWGIAFHHPTSLATPLHTALHPTQIYLFVAGLTIFFILLAVQKKKSIDGEILWSYLLLESISRIFIEQFRAEYQPFIIWIGVILLLISSIQIYRLKNKKWRECMKQPIWKITALVLVVALTAACGVLKTQRVERGHDIDKGDVNDIVKGTTTEREILKLFGPPTKLRDTDAGKELYYEYTKTGGFKWDLLISIGGSSVTKTLLVWLDKNGVVTDYAYKKT